MLELFFFIKERISSLTVFGEGLRSSKEWGPRCFSSLIPHQTKIWFSKVFPNSVLKFWGEFLSVKFETKHQRMFLGAPLSLKKWAKYKSSWDKRLRFVFFMNQKTCSGSQFEIDLRHCVFSFFTTNNLYICISEQEFLTYFGSTSQFQRFGS